MLGLKPILGRKMSLKLKKESPSGLQSDYQVIQVNGFNHGIGSHGGGL